MGRVPSGIAKETFLAAMTCPTQGWYVARQEQGVPTLAQLFRMQGGIEIGRRARALWGEGVLVRSVELDAAAAETQRLMETPSTVAIFEATFRVDGYTAKADILLRKAESWRQFEVKSSLHDDEGPKEEHIDDLAYTAMVLLKCGVKLASTELVLLRRDYRLGQPDANLFVTSDHTTEVLQLVSGMQQFWKPVQVAVLGERRPEHHQLFGVREDDDFWTCKTVPRTIRTTPEICRAAL